MAAAEEPNTTLTLGGKAPPPLTPTDVYSIAIQKSNITINPSISTTKTPQTKTINSYSFTIPNYKLTKPETRASFLILLNKLISSNSISSANQLLNIINNININNVNDDVDVVVIDDVVCEDLYYDSCVVIGVSALIDYLCGNLSVLAEGVAALSCEGLGGNFLGVFGLTDSGDGSCSKDVVAVASDFRVLFKDSKKGSVEKVFSCVEDVPVVYGKFRTVFKALHSVVRVGLKSGGGGGGGKEFGPELFALGVSLFDLGSSSLSRGEMVLEKVENEGLRRLECPVGSGRLREFYVEMKTVENTISLVHKVYELLDAVWKIVSWEGLVAFVALEGSEVFAEKKVNESVGESGSGVESGKGGEKKSKKKKKSGLGAGCLAFTQFIKDTVVTGEGNGGLDKFVVDFGAVLDLTGDGFQGFVKKLKDIVESNDSRRLPKLPKGTRDCSEEDMAIRERAFSIITNVFKSHGATALDTPVFEMRETLTGKYGEDSKLIYDLADQGGELYSLRYDLTVPFARHVAMKNLTSFKRYQIAKVYRRDNPAKGRFREFYQCDFDIAGQSEKMGPDFEVIKILTEILNKLNFGDYEVKLNHRRLLDGMLAICGVPEAKFRTICSSIDKLDKQSFEQIKEEMVGKKGLNVEAADKIIALVKHRGPPLELLSKLQEEGSEFLQHEESKLALNELEILFKTLDRSKCLNKIVFDLSLARGLDYYTGVIFEAVFKGTTQAGSIAAGGRYDNLIGMFGNKQVPAVGISLGIERVFAIMEGKKQDIRATETQVLVSVLFDDLPLAGELASELWDAGVKAEFSVDKRKKKHLLLAEKAKIPYMLIAEEARKEVVILRDVGAGTEEVVSKEEFVKVVLERLN